MYFVSGEDENPNGIGLLRKTLRWLVRCNLRQAAVVLLVTHNSPVFLNGEVLMLQRFCPLQREKFKDDRVLVTSMVCELQVYPVVS